MTDDNADRRLTRRNALRIAGAAGAASLAGCGGSDGGSSGDGSDGSGGQTSDGSGGETSDGSTDSGTQYNELEVAHWWGEGDGLEAIQSVMDAFSEKHPDVPFNENLIAGGAGSNLQANIRTRVQNGNHPSTWQSWPGKNLLPYTDANLLKDIGDSVWSKNSMKDAYLGGVKKAAQPAGNYVTVPLNIHRINNLFYNVKVVEDAGVDPSSIKTPSDLISALKTVEDAGYTGMAHQTGAPWSSFQMFATVLLGETDAETYSAIFEDGKIDANSDALQGAVETTQSYLDYIPSDAGSISWTEANNQVINGEAAFLHQGDWAAGTYITNDLTYGEQWDHVAFPGTSDYYALNMDSFPYPINNPSPKATTLWSRFVGTTEAQEIFNPKKGSIPPRTDVSTEPFNDFSKDQIKDFQNSTAQPLSVAHGLAAPPAVKSSLGSAISSLNSGAAPADVVSQISSAYQ